MRRDEAKQNEMVHITTKRRFLEPSWVRPGSSLPRPGAFLDASWSRSGQENRRKQAQYSIFNARRKKVGPNRRDMHQLALAPCPSPDHAAHGARRGETSGP